MVFDEAAPARLMRELKPGGYVKGVGYRVEDLLAAEVAREIGAEVEILPFEEGHATCAPIEKIRGMLGTDR